MKYLLGKAYNRSGSSISWPQYNIETTIDWANRLATWVVPVAQQPFNLGNRIPISTTKEEFRSIYKNTITDVE
jgi:hypothetical protein